MRSDGNEENRRNDGPATHAVRRRDRSMQASYSSRWIMSRRAILVLVLLSLACGDEVTEPKPEATKVEPVGSNKLTGTVGSALEVMPTVRVLDQKGRPMSGVSVVWDVTRGDGSVDPKSTMTDASGTASTKWTLGPMAGRQSITASAENLPAVAFEAEALPDVPA